ncbi:MAG: isocitrate/isopropylmalate dehydrogenase family protein [Dehalococcoidia bacterium]|nr:isocitrate/isopropylmalate dehydrogenase family protein [Dehalococcoidia bacterium]
MPYNVTLIPGDGTGPEVARAACRVLEATGIKFRWDVFQVGEAVQKLFGTPLPDDVLESIRHNRIALKGPVTTPIGSGFRSVNVAMRKTLNLYACLRPCKTYRGVPGPYPNVDITVVRENTEDLYAGIEFKQHTPEMAKLIALIAESGQGKLGEDANISIKAISETGSRRIVKFAFEYARNHGRKKVTVVHKANIMKFTDGLFLSVAREVAHEYPDIEMESAMVDNMCMQLVRWPQSYQVLVLPNLYGDIVSDLCAGLVGGLGVAPGANIGEGIAVFEPTHGSAPKYAGKNKVNPIAMILSGMLMLRYLGETKAADLVEKSVSEVVAEGESVTYDLKPDRNDPTAVGTSQVADAIIEKMRRA